MSDSKLAAQAKQIEHAVGVAAGGAQELLQPDPVISAGLQQVSQFGGIAAGQQEQFLHEDAVVADQAQQALQFLGVAAYQPEEPPRQILVLDQRRDLGQFRALLNPPQAFDPLGQALDDFLAEDDRDDVEYGAAEQLAAAARSRSGRPG